MLEKKKYQEILIKKTMPVFEKHGFDVTSFNNHTEVLSKILEIIPQDAVIGYGGSRTLEQIGFFDYITVKNYPNLLDRKKPDISPDEKKALQRKALLSDYYLCSANAVSQTGRIYNIDKWGNRVGATIYGPEKVILVIGANKICLTDNEALSRVRNYASPLNTIRFNLKTPCTSSGHCHDCFHEDRICGTTVIIDRCLPKNRISLFFVAEDLGF